MPAVKRAKKKRPGGPIKVTWTGPLKGTVDAYRLRATGIPGFRRKDCGTIYGLEETKRQAAIKEQLLNEEHGGKRKRHCLTVREYWPIFLAARDRAGYRNTKRDDITFSAHIEPTIGDVELDEITPESGQAWAASLETRETQYQKTKFTMGFENKRISFSTWHHCVVLLRVMLQHASEEHPHPDPDKKNDRKYNVKPVIPINPLANVRIRRKSRHDEESEKVSDSDHVMRPEQQRTLLTCEAVDIYLRLMIQFALGTGLRLSEQWNLRLEDIEADDKGTKIKVRRSVGGRSTKSKKVRTVRVFGLAKEALDEWLRLLPTYCPKNDLGLVFPTASGYLRQQHSYGYADALKKAGLPHFRWHDLRHSCATSLLAGWWGKRWPKESVQAHLGHSSITTTERYARLVEEFTSEDAVETTATGFLASSPKAPPTPAAPPQSGPESGPELIQRAFSSRRSLFTLKPRKASELN